MSKNVLIYALRKSGSSLTQCLLDNNYQFTHPNESKLIYFDRVVGNHKDYHFVENNLSSIFQFRFEKDLPIDLPNKILSALPFITNIEKFLRFDLELAQNYSYNNPVCNFTNDGFIIKEVGGVPNKIISRFLQAFPDGFLVFVFRDPRECASAVFRQRKKSGRKVSLYISIRLIIEPYYIMNELLKMEKIKDIKSISFHYHDVTNNPNLVCKEYSHFIDLPSPPTPIPTLNCQNVAVKTGSSVDPSLIRPRLEPWYRGLSLFQSFLIFTVSILRYRTIYRVRKKLHENSI